MRAKQSKIFGDNLRIIRHEKGMTQKEVAEMLGIDRTTYTKYETGVTEPPFCTIKAIAEIYNTDYNALFDRRK